MSTIARLIQKKVPLGGTLAVVTKTQEKFEGILTEIALEYLSICLPQGSHVTIMLENISHWTVPTTNSSENEKISKPIEVLQKSEPSTALAKEHLNELIALATDLEIQAAKANFTLHEPDFIFPETELPKKPSITKIWGRMRDSYENARKIGELHPKFNRIGQIKALGEELCCLCPESPTPKHYYAFFLFLTGKQNEAVENEFLLAQKSFSQEILDNLGHYCILTGKNDLAGATLEKAVFSKFPLNNEMYFPIYLRLEKTFPKWSLIHKIAAEDFGKDNVNHYKWLKKVVSFQMFKANFLQEAFAVRQLEDSFSSSKKLLDFLSLLGLSEIPCIENVKRQLDHSQSVVKVPFATLGSQTGVAQENQAPNNERFPEVKNEDLLKGRIYFFSPQAGKHFGFIRDSEGKEYWFHISSVCSGEIVSKLESWPSGKNIPVQFDFFKGPKGLVARNILPLEGTVTILETEKNRNFEYRRFSKTPKNLYYQARDYFEKGDLVKAEELFRSCISTFEKPFFESALKDLASLLCRNDIGRENEAMELLENHLDLVSDRISLENHLLSVYEKNKAFSKALSILQRLELTAPASQRNQIRYRISICLMGLKDYPKAEKSFWQLFNHGRRELGIVRNLALCLVSQKKFSEAEKLLNDFGFLADDPRFETIKTIIHEAKAGSLDNNIEAETALVDLQDTLRGFMSFLLERSSFMGVSPAKIENQTFSKQDLDYLESKAKEAGTRRPRERSEYYLSAAKIISLQDLEEVDSMLFSAFCARSLVSKADAIIYESKPLDSARDLYCEAAFTYEAVIMQHEEQDFVNAIKRYFQSALGASQVILDPHKGSGLDQSLKEVFKQVPEKKTFFEFIRFLGARSKKAFEKVLRISFQTEEILKESIVFLKENGVQTLFSSPSISEYLIAWDNCRKEIFQKNRNISNQLQSLRATLSFSAPGAENSQRILKSLRENLFLTLDRQRLDITILCFKEITELCRQVDFHERERWCLSIQKRVEELGKEIEDCPTRISTEEIFPIISKLKELEESYLETLYQTTEPKIGLRLAIEKYSPIDNKIELQIVIENATGCSPAEKIQFIVQQEEDGAFHIGKGELSLLESLKGGDSQTKIIPVNLKPETINQGAFSFPIFVQYETRTGNKRNSPIESLSVNLSEEFHEIENPFSPGAEGGLVVNERMFFGRDELISNLANSLTHHSGQKKCIVIYGQKRSGKSSILFHLKKRLSKGAIIADFSIGSIISQFSLPVFLFKICQRLQDAIEELTDEGLPSLEVSFPTLKELEDGQILSFNAFFTNLKRAVKRTRGWENRPIVLMIDEFTYLYGQIIRNNLSNQFPRNLKSLLEQQLFSAVLVGQDCMPKFKKAFPNEFGIMQDERVTYLRPEDAKRLIDEPIRIAGSNGASRYREGAIGKILELTAGNPFYIQMFCNRLVEHLNRKKQPLATDATIEQVKNELISGVNALSEDKFDNLIDGGDESPDAIPKKQVEMVLKFLAQETQTENFCSVDKIKLRFVGEFEFQKILDDLLRREVLQVERGVYFRIRVGLFKDWLCEYS